MVYQKEIIEEVLKELARETNVKEISNKYQISESTIYSWQKKHSNELEYKKLCVKTSKAIKKLIKIDIYEALNLSMQPCFQDCFFIQAQRIAILVNLKRLEEALSLCREPRFYNYAAIASEQITILMKLGRLEEALKLSEESRFSKDCLIQSQRIAVLIALNRLEEALALSKESQFYNDFTIQSQQLTVLIKLGKLKEAYNLSNEKRFSNNFKIASQRITILIKLNRLEEALNLTKEERFQNDYFIQTQQQQILRLLSIRKNQTQTKTEEKIKKRASKLLKKILNVSADRLDTLKEIILGANILEWQKVILLIALYEKAKYPRTAIMSFLKEQTQLYSNNPDILKIIKALSLRIKNNTNIFDIKFYEKLLAANVTFNPIKEKAISRKRKK